MLETASRKESSDRLSEELGDQVLPLEDDLRMGSNRPPPQVNDFNLKIEEGLQNNLSKKQKKKNKKSLQHDDPDTLQPSKPCQKL